MLILDARTMALILVDLQHGVLALPLTPIMLPTWLREQSRSAARSWRRAAPW